MIQVKKRSGDIVPFDITKIEGVLLKVLPFNSQRDPVRIAALTEIVLGKVMEVKEKVIGVEEIQDMVRDALMTQGYTNEAQAFVLYRAEKTKIRNEKKKVLNTDNLDWLEEKFSLNSLRVLAERCLKKNDNNEVIESPIECFIRVATVLGDNDVRYGLNGADMATKYINLMASQQFLPNSPALYNLGANNLNSHACFVLPIEDDLRSIMKTASDMAWIFKSGGGVGINYSAIRPKGDRVGTTGGVASGPRSFMRIIDVTTDVVKQGGKRRGANMGILNIDHPDIEDFISCKRTPGVLENFNISVGFHQDFWEALRIGDTYPLVNPRNGQVTKRVDPAAIINLIAESAWASAEPGVIFFDHINEYNPMLDFLGEIRGTNPCSEIPLYTNEPCVLGSINVAKFVDEDGNFKSEDFIEAIKTATYFLDNLIDVNNYPLEETRYMSMQLRRIGLGLMGIADALYLMNIPYNSQRGMNMVGFWTMMLTLYSMLTSSELARDRGKFPLFDESKYAKGELPFDKNMVSPFMSNMIFDAIKEHGIRNCWTTTLAPTGSISMIADCSNGIEPNFALAYEKRTPLGSFFYTNQIFENVLKERGLLTDEIIQKISDNGGSCQGIDEIPEDVQKVFVTAMDIHWADHVVMQAMAQRYITNAISKTINMPENATRNDIKQAYLLAYHMKCKSISVYRDNSRDAQVLISSKAMNRPLPVISEYAKNELGKSYMKMEESPMLEEELLLERRYNKCPNCNSHLIAEAGCYKCLQCNYQACSIS